jgi:hypothetical protein
MRRSWAVTTAAPVAVALMMACSRKVDDTSSATSRRADLGGRQAQTIALRGCLQAARGTSEYVLQHVQFEPATAQPSDAATSVGLTVTEGSWVRLVANDNDLFKDKLGQVVSVSGTVKDDGRNTIGTGGNTSSPEQAQSPVDLSRAAGNEHHADKQSAEAGPGAQHGQANGTAPELAVEKVTPTGEKCQG